jgi:hypothetical protein
MVMAEDSGPFAPFHLAVNLPVSLVPRIDGLPGVYSSSVTGTSICFIQQDSNYSLPMFHSLEMSVRGYTNYPG